MLSPPIVSLDFDGVSLEKFSCTRWDAFGSESCEACKETRRIFFPPPKGVLDEELFRMISCEIC
jgi:hypothetical protein